MTHPQAHRASGIRGEYLPPGDKSISHRLVMLGALADGVSEFSHFLEADDCLRTIKAFQAMGVGFGGTDQEKTKPVEVGSTLKVRGVGLRGLSKPLQELDLGNSGTTMRLLLGILAGQPFEVRLTGDSSLARRPMRRVTDPLRKMGAQIRGRDEGNYAPLVIQGGHLNGIRWKNEVASAQVKSALLLAGLYAEGETSVEEPILSRDHTERLLKLFRVPIQISGRIASIRKTEKLSPIQFDVPGDFSSAAFFMVAACLLPGSDLVIRRVGLNPTRIGLLNVLKSMGADLTIEAAQNEEEPVGSIRVKSSKLKGVTIKKEAIPTMIDELPILMVACSLAQGTSVIQGAEELRVKETDRIYSMASGLSAIGAKALERSDGCVIEGVSEFKGGAVSSFGDHRTAMSFLIANLRSKQEVTVQDVDCIKTSYPGFQEDLNRLYS